MSNTCVVCNAPRDNHPYRHPFQGNVDSDITLTPEKAQPKAVPVDDTQLQAMFFRLIQLLVRKGLVDGDELAVIIGARPAGDSDSDRGDRGATQAD